MFYLFLFPLLERVSETTNAAPPTTATATTIGLTGIFSKVFSSDPAPVSSLGGWICDSVGFVASSVVSVDGFDVSVDGFEVSVDGFDVSVDGFDVSVDGFDVSVDGC